MDYLAVGLGAGMVGAIGTFVLHFLLMRQQGHEVKYQRELASELRGKLDDLRDECTELEKVHLIDTTNITELKRELSTKAETIASLEARVASVEKAHADVLTAIQDHPSALPVVVGSAFARLRQAVSKATGHQGGDPAARDQGGGEEGVLHEAAPLPPPR